MRDPDRGLSDPFDAAAQFKQRLIAIADRSVLLADSTKLNRRAVVFFAWPMDVDELITDADADTGAIEKLRGLGMAYSTVQA